MNLLVEIYCQQLSNRTKQIKRVTTSNPRKSFSVLMDGEEEVKPSGEEMKLMPSGGPSPYLISLAGAARAGIHAGSFA
jgi:hypothetical protein